MNRKRTAFLYIAALLALNLWIMARVFRTEFSPHMSSIEGAFVGLEQWLRGHWEGARWFPLWYGGTPIENAYPPFLHFTIAFVSLATGMSVVHTFNAVTAAFYCLGPVALFCLVLQLTRSQWKAFLAGWIYSLISASAFLIPPIARDLGTVWGARKMQTIVIYGEGPHNTAIALLLFALAAIYAALEHEIGWKTIVAVFLAAAAAMTNWLGAMALVWGVLALLIARKGPRMSRATMKHIVLIGVLAYAVAMPWITPTDIEAVQRNARHGAYPMGAGQYLYLAVWLGAAFGLGYWLKKTSVSEGGRFALVFLLFMTAPPVGYQWFKIYPLPQPERYHLEMDVAFAIAAGIVFGSYRLASKYRWWRGAVIAGVVVLAAIQAPRWRSEVHAYLPPFDITKTVEREQALFLGSHYPGQRVYVTGSTRFWLNAFTDNPQLDGDFDQGISNPAIPYVTYSLTALEGNGRDAVATLKAYGVRAIAVGGEHTRDAYRDYADPGKFAGVVPEVWRDGDDAIYEIPDNGSLAHVVNKSDLVSSSPLDRPAISRFAGALDANEATTHIRWDGPNHAVIQAELKKPQVVSVQVSWDQGWRASVNHLDFPTQKDALGLLVLSPPCEGNCTIDLVFDGGMQGRIADLACLSGFVVCGMFVLRDFRRKSPKEKG